MAKKDYSNLSKEQLLEVIEKLEGKKKYGLVWDEERVPEKVVTDCQDKLPVLTEVKDKGITTDENKPTHILIEGDNYHALSVLNYTHKGKIDFIYIDPPYNTGSKDFKYNDRFVEKEDTWKHSKWLNFMNQRLMLAKELLKDNATIFISIDDNEQSQLKLLLDKVFGEENFIGIFIHKNNSSKNQAKLLSVSTEYLIVYAKNKKEVIKNTWRIEKKGSRDIVLMFKKLKKKGLSLEDIDKEIKEMYSRPKYAHFSRWNKVDDNGVFKDADLSREGGPKDYTIINPNTGKPCVVPDRGWGKSYDELIKLQESKMIWYGDENTPPGIKDYIEEDREMVPDNFLYFDNSSDTRLIKEMFGFLAFENPKPKEMIKSIISMATNDNSIILDFFAGSGTTAHAVLELNKAEGNRQFIVCTNNENNICENVTYPRIDKTIKGFSSKKTVYDGSGNNLKYFKTSFVANNRNKDQLKIDITKQCTEMLCLKEGIFNLLKEEADYKIFQQSNRYFAVYYDFANASLDELKEEMNALNGEKVLYCFTVDTNGLDKANFSDWKNIRLEPIPQKILDVYKRIFKN